MTCNYSALSCNILQRLRVVLSDETMSYQLHEPMFTGNESKYVQDCLESGWVSSTGSYVNQFESQLSTFTGIDYVVATVNGTAALHTCLLVAGVEPEDEVLLPTLTFVATANVVRYCSAIPHFVDSDFETLGVCPEKLAVYLEKITEIKERVCYNKKTGRKISALCVTHIFGHPVNLDALLLICKRFHLKLIEDASEALGTFYKHQHVGAMSHLAALSFNGNKIITTGGGGAVITNVKALAEKVRHLTTTARLQHRWHFIHDEVGYNYRMPNINAALGCAQLEQIKPYLTKKRTLANHYLEAFSDFDPVRIFCEPKDARSNYWLNAMVLEKPDPIFQETILAVMHNNKIMSRPIWYLMHRLAMYSDFPKMDLSNAEDLWKRVILLPSSPGIVDQPLSAKKFVSEKEGL